MARKTKTAETTTAKPARRSRKKTTQEVEVAYTAAEMVYVAKYPNHKFVPGSLSAPGEITIFGKKRVISIRCNKCNIKDRTIATSDIFHCDKCVECTSLAKKENRKSKKQAPATTITETEGV